ncbi:GNAT family N-acetyltransferase [Janthinobacterium fluminis]|uniref:GNAT family N-acetyltransferase n=1 Tax=Janthinobacterium fluminis TaxID=2987524 RepID=A0ABT5K816_9BURK|nr:GNAT family N-acetyltransferase [Janthinobacterium fluminis]MDC8760585.1 GNAT family N-acetyltransferase [Janthinobacterium fluminis]
MKAWLKIIARAMLGEYSAYYVLSRGQDDGAAARPPQAQHYRVALVDQAAIRRCPDALMREQAAYAGDGALAYACLCGERIVGLCFYWHGARYATRNFWPLKNAEAKLVQIICSPDMRGKKVAATLIAASCADVMRRGFQRAYARVWHSNAPSLRAFAGAGWTRRALLIEVHPFGRKRPLRFRFAGRMLARPAPEL